MYKFHKSHILVIITILFSLYLIYKHGLNHVSYVGREVPLFILGICFFLILVDCFPILIHGNNTWISSLITIVVGCVLLITILITLDKISEIREEHALKVSDFTTGEVMGFQVKFDFRELDDDMDDESAKPYWLYYKYVVDGTEYKQASVTEITLGDKREDAKNLPYERGQEIQVEYSRSNPIVSRVVGVINTHE